MKTALMYFVGGMVAVASGLIINDQWRETRERQAVLEAKARSVTEDLIIHSLIVPHHKARSTPVITMTYHVMQPLNAGFGASIIAADGSVFCPHTSGKAGGIQIPQTLTPVIRMPLSRLVGPCELPPGRYTLAVRFNVQIGGVMKSMSVESAPFVVME